MKFYMEIFVALISLIQASVVFTWDHPKFANRGQFPHQVSLELHMPPHVNEFHCCGGAIIEELWILTSAYCVTNIRVQNLFVKVGRHNITADDEHVQKIRIDKVIVHPKYMGVWALENLGPYDIALIKLEKAITFNANVQPIQLPEKSGFFSGYKLNYNLILNGWGAIANTVLENHPKVLYTINVPIIPNKICRDLIKNLFPHYNLDDSQMCTRPIDGSLGACIGDYGGPLIQYDKNNRPVVVAVYSWTTMLCNTNGLPPIYTRVYPFTKWIRSTIKAYK